jgi:hypothetical protein
LIPNLPVIVTDAISCGSAIENERMKRASYWSVVDRPGWRNRGHWPAEHTTETVVHRDPATARMRYLWLPAGPRRGQAFDRLTERA